MKKKNKNVILLKPALCNTFEKWQRCLAKFYSRKNSPTNISVTVIYLKVKLLLTVKGLSGETLATNITTNGITVRTVKSNK
jgi:hypothetical protein